MGMDTNSKFLSEKPLCSVCIANYNGLSTLADCLDSVLGQDCDFAVEIIVHDDASTDGSVAWMQARYPMLRIIASPDNVGFCVSNNRMGEAARGDFLLLLNNDAALYPDALRSFYEYAKQQAKPGILGLPQYQMQTGKLIDRGNIFDLFLNPIPNFDKNRTKVGMVIGACLWIPMTLWKELGGFPEWFHTLAEDMFLCCYAVLQGYPVEVLPYSGFKHYQGNTLGGSKITNEQKLCTTLKRRSLSERNKTFVMVLCYPFPWLWMILPLHIFFLTIEGLVLSISLRNYRLWKEVYWYCFKVLWSMRTYLYAQRRNVQKHRKVSAQVFFASLSFFPHKLRMLLKYGLPFVK